LRHDKLQWAEQTASSGQAHLLRVEIKDTFAKFCQLKQKCTTTSEPTISTDAVICCCPKKTTSCKILTYWSCPSLPSLNLRSAATPTLVVPSTRRSTLGDRAFPVAAAHAWNSLPSSLRAVQSLTTFRRRLKTELFDSSFTWLSYCTINMCVFSLILYSALATAISRLTSL